MLRNRTFFQKFGGSLSLWSYGRFATALTHLWSAPQPFEPLSASPDWTSSREWPARLHWRSADSSAPRYWPRWLPDRTRHSLPWVYLSWSWAASRSGPAIGRQRCQPSSSGELLALLLVLGCLFLCRWRRFWAWALVVVVGLRMALVGALFLRRVLFLALQLTATMCKKWVFR